MNDSIRLGFDAYYFQHPMTRMGQYAIQLWRALTRRVDSGHRCLLAPAGVPAVEDEADDATIVSASVPQLPDRVRKVWWEQAGLPGARKRTDVDLVHIPYFTAPALDVGPLVVTIHDVIPLVLPAYAGSKMMRAYLRMNCKTVQRADLVLTGSEHSRCDIHARLEIPLERIRVTPLAASHAFHPVQSEEDRDRVREIRERYGFGRPFVLYVGGFDRRKRLPELIAAFALANAQAGHRYDLVIAGSPHTGNRRLYPSITPEIKRWGIGDKVHLTGFVPDQDLPDLY
ncbi:MAG: glycosyltransferase, partial [Chloroflexota bacterium]